VSSSVFRKDKRLFVNTAIQSNTVCPRDLLSRTELFMESFLRDIREDSEMPGRFESIKAALLARLIEPFDSLGSKLNHLNYLAYEEEANWDFIQQKMLILKEYRFEELQRFAGSKLGRLNRKRVAVLGYGDSAENKEFIYAKL